MGVNDDIERRRKYNRGCGFRKSSLRIFGLVHVIGNLTDTWLAGFCGSAAGAEINALSGFFRRKERRALTASFCFVFWRRDRRIYRCSAKWASVFQVASASENVAC